MISGRLALTQGPTKTALGRATIPEIVKAQPSQLTAWSQAWSDGLVLVLPHCSSRSGLVVNRLSDSLRSLFSSVL